MIEIRALQENDYPFVSQIYQQGIDTGNATFETAPKTWQDWNAAALPICRIVAVLHGSVVGWAALFSVSDRCVYAGVAELSVYVDTSVRSKGVGSELMVAIISDSEKNGFWTLQSGIFPENQASIRLHEKYGFRLVGIRHRLGNDKGRWRDVATYERRSDIVGI